ncbi:MAG TPA: hypothetical protein VFT13_00020, partial [Candidatus Krumholzibacteria bacterium]|nr:hypothetical protein [Candidatus Krumholzibacteria bacterium]
MTRSLLLWGLLLSPVMPATAQPAFTVSISADKSDYLPGEPIRLSVLVRNAGRDTVYVPEYRRDNRPDVFMSLTPSRGDRRFVRIRDHLPMTRLCPGDSLQFFAQVARNNGEVDAAGASIGKKTKPVLFDRPGEYLIHICCLEPGQEGARPVVARSNALTLRIGKPSSADKRIIDALWDLRAIDDYRTSVYGMRVGEHDRSAADRLQNLMRRCAG